jgi:hypothetical protein
MSSLIIETGLPSGVTWKPKIVRHARDKARSGTKKTSGLKELNRRLAATRAARLAAAEKNCMNLTGKTSF